MIVLFLKAVDRHDQATGDLFSQVVNHVGYVDKQGHAHRPHAQRHLVKPEAIAPVEHPATEDIPAPSVIEAWMSEGKLARLKEKVEALNKKAAKIGMPPITLTTSGERFMQRVHSEEYAPRSDSLMHFFRAEPMGYVLGKGETSAGIIKQFNVKMEGQPPKIAGWGFVASIDHTNKGNILRGVPGGGGVPAKYRTAKPVCEHCNQDRMRNNTFVLRHDSGETKQVGRTCLKDFLGHQSAEHMAGVAANTWEVFREAGGDDFLGDGETRTHYVETKTYLRHAAADIRQFGWTSRAAAEERGQVSTADSAATRMHQDDKLEPEDIALADAALEWAKSLQEEKTLGSDFLHNIGVVAKMDGITIRQFGIAAAIIIAYQKDQEEARAKVDTLPSAYQGAIGQRGKFTGLTLNAVIPIEGYYGMTYLHHFADADGNQFKWFASSNAMSVGQTYDIDATVKGHEEYKGTLQTVLTRAKISEKATKPPTKAEKAGYQARISALRASGDDDALGALWTEMLDKFGEKRANKIVDELDNPPLAKSHVILFMKAA